MNYSIAFSSAVKIESAYSAAQAWIKNEAPVIEKQIERFAVKSIIQTLEIMLIVIDFLADRYEEIPEYVLLVKIFTVKVKRQSLEATIKVIEFDQYHGITRRIAGVWNQRAVIASNAMDTVLCLK